MKDKRIKIFTPQNFKEKKEMDKEPKSKLPSLVDKDEKIPTLQEYLDIYCRTGIVPKTFSRSLEEYNDESEEFHPQDIRNTDIEDLKDYKDFMRNQKDLYFKLKNKKKELEKNGVFKSQDVEEKKNDSINDKK